MAGMSGIKAVFIDVDDTLLDFNECAREDIRNCFRKNGLEYSDLVFDFFLARNIRLWKRIEDGLLTVDELHRTRWAGIFRDLGIDADGPSFEQDFIAGLRETSVPVAGAHGIMEYLHSRYHLFLVSNASGMQQTRRMEKAGLMKYVDGMFGSLDIGIIKPSKGYFDYCFSRMDGITPAETVIIGDSLNADIKGGAEYGLRTIWFNIRNVQLSSAVSPDYTVRSLEEIKSIL